MITEAKNVGNEGILTEMINMTCITDFLAFLSPLKHVGC